MITYKQYKKLGYTAVPKEQFQRFIQMTEMAVRKFSNRKFYNHQNADSKDKLDENMERGLCEICDIYYDNYEDGGKVAGFANDGYREQYFEDTDVHKRVFDLIQLYFPREQLYRGI